MTKKPAPSQSALDQQLSRRRALVGLGGLSLFPSALTALGCGDAGPGGAGSGGGLGVGGTSGGSPSGGAGALSGGAPGAGGRGIGGAAALGGSPNAGGANSSGGASGSAAAGGESAAGGSSGGAEATGGTGGSVGEDGIVPPGPWDEVATCRATYSDGAGQGPFMIHELEMTGDISMYRKDIRGRYNPQAEAGVEMQLHLRILNGENSSCGETPVEDVEVYVWHTDAQGYYSGFGTRGTNKEQTPDSRYAGVPASGDIDTVDMDRFCRGVQKTGADGVVSFRSIFPGWYNGRDVHIHVLLLHSGSTSKGRNDYTGAEHYLTTQFYFDPELTDSVHKSAQPYLRRTEGSLATVYQGAIAADESGNSGVKATARFEEGIVFAQINVLLNPDQSLTVQNNRRP